jgi:CRP/FNR family transcriptional regulator
MNEQALKKLKTFYSAYKPQEFKKGEILIHAFENPKEIYFLEEGNVKMYTITKSGNDLIVNIFKQFSFFPMSQVLTNLDNRYYYEAMTKVKIRSVPSEKFLAFVKSEPEILLDLIERLYKGMDGILLKMTYAMTSDAQSRLIAELLTRAQRFGKKIDGYYVLNISQNDLALATGLARETVTRGIKLLKEKKLISIKNKEITVIDLEKLEKEID